MAKRPAQGRGSGGRVTPAGGARPRARVPAKAAPKGRVATREAPVEDRPAGDGAPAARPRGLVRAILDPQGAAGGERVAKERPWWGFGDVIAWFVIGQVVTMILPLFVAQQAGYALDRPVGPGARMGEVVGRVATGQQPSVTLTWVDLPLWLSQGVLLLPLWACFVGGAVFATVRKGFGPVKDLKIEFRRVDLLVGVVVGLASQLVMSQVLYKILFVFTGEQDVSARARDLADKATSPVLVVLLFVTVGIVAPVAEELFFRGLTLRSLERRFGRIGGLILTSAFFAVAHGNPLFVVALFPFGLVLGWLTQRYDRLGPAVVAHVAYNLVTATLLVSGLAS